jgi:hypothetical protein
LIFDEDRRVLDMALITITIGFRVPSLRKDYKEDRQTYRAELIQSFCIKRFRKGLRSELQPPLARSQDALYMYGEQIRVSSERYQARGLTAQICKKHHDALFLVLKFHLVAIFKKVERRKRTGSLGIACGVAIL